MHIALAGATGAVGTYLLHLLQQAEPVQELHLLTRRPLDGLATKTQTHLLSFDELPNYPFEGSLDVAICTLGTTQKKAGKEGFYRVDHDYVVAFGKWAQIQGAKTYIVITSIGANPDTWYSFYLQTKGKTETDVKALGFERTVFVQPPLLEGPRAEHRPTEVIGSKVMGVLKPLFIGPLKYSLPVHLSQVAACIWDAAQLPQPGIFVLGPKEIHQFPSFDIA